MELLRLRASGVLITEPVKFKVLDTESFGEYLQQYGVINGVECCAEIQQHQGRHKAGVSGTYDVVVNDCDGRLSRVVHMDVHPVHDQALNCFGDQAQIRDWSA